MITMGQRTPQYAELIAARVPVTIIERIDRLSTQQRITRAEAIRRILMRGLVEAEAKLLEAA